MDEEPKMLMYLGGGLPERPPLGPIRIIPAKAKVIDFKLALVERRERARAHRLAGKGPREIAELMGVAESSVHNWTRDLIKGAAR